MRIYVAGPYSHPTPEGRLLNTRIAMDVCVHLILKGHIPYCPHLSHFLDERAREMGHTLSYEEWMRQDEAWLMQSEALYLIAHSPGADQELLIAQTVCRIPVYRTLDEVPTA